MAVNVSKMGNNNSYSTNLKQVENEWGSFNLNESKCGSGDMGTLIPIYERELLPGQKISINNNIALQFMPFVTNLFHRIKGEVMTYFIPYRLLWDKWEDFITGGKDGLDKSKIPKINIRVEPGPTAKREDLLHTLIDYFGMPLTIQPPATTDDNQPDALIFNAYNLVYDEHIKNIDVEPNDTDPNSKTVKRAYWENDYFTKARIFQERGVVPTVPISDELEQLEHKITKTKVTDTTEYDYAYTTELVDETSGNTERDNKSITPRLKGKNSGGAETTYGDYTQYVLEDHELSNLGMNINDLLQAISIMKYQTANARVQPRYIEQLKMRFGIYPQDARLNRPEFLGTSYFGIGTQTVTQTSVGDNGQTQQGNITGQAWGSGQNLSAQYTAQEHGIIMQIMCIRPVTVYEGGLDKMWNHKTKFEFYTPEFRNLPDTALTKGELYYNGRTELDDELFGWQGIYEHYRVAKNKVTGYLRPSLKGKFKTYTLARFWESNPQLNETFLHCNPDKARIMQYPDEPTFIFFVESQVNTAAPIPLQADPTRMDILGA